MIRISRPIKSTNGFTLIELLVVVALIALITVFAVPSVSSYFKVSLNSAARELAGVIKEAYNATALTGKVNRLVYDFKSNSFWVESALTDDILLDTKESREKEERRSRFSKKNEEEKPASSFVKNRTVTRKEMRLPRGVTFEDIVSEQNPEPITEGTAYTHFFPHGLTEQTTIHLKDTSDHHVTLIISPLIGRTRVIDRYVKDDESYEEDE
ncbi:MAG: hypothetical protein A3K03_13380 [Bdellovibrionales bacterium RIFOXYD1_FULL_44_7]|nr:MAG: hypothetical protein A3K03_13380 [Bdellovibrionales bacterium RIFOXYD1_FULL_44_7]